MVDHGQELDLWRLERVFYGKFNHHTKGASKDSKFSHFPSELSHKIKKKPLL
jgi:hypothetical protein